jgi:hypothetical protein
MSFFSLEILKGKPTKSREIIFCLKLSKTYAFETKKSKKKTKIPTHMDLWKYDQILTIHKFLTIKQLRF